MKEAWLMAGAVVPVDVETTSELVAEIKRLIDVVGGMALAQQEPVDGTQVSKVWWDGEKLMAKPIPLEDIYQPVDWKAEYLKSVESGCITLDELREANAELAATNRQVEILSDALAESRREVASLKANAALDKKAENAKELGLDYEPAPVQEPFGYVYEVYCLPECAWEMEWVESFDRYEPDAEENIRNVTPVYTTPPAAQPAVPDAFGTREGEHPQYIQGWNDCRAEMLKGMK
jgi:hypothetical protein